MTGGSHTPKTGLTAMDSSLPDPHGPQSCIVSRRGDFMQFGGMFFPNSQFCGHSKALRPRRHPQFGRVADAKPR